MIRSMRVKNLRSLKDTGSIDLKPITVLLGKNSSGKSTFARCFPLIKQSVQKRTKGPVLWYGEGDYVDFGSFETALFDGSEKEEIVFEFEMNVPVRHRNLYSFNSTSRKRLIGRMMEVGASLYLESDGKNTYSRKLSIKVQGVVFDIVFDSNHNLENVYCDDVAWIDPRIGQRSRKINIYAKGDSFFPVISTEIVDDGQIFDVSSKRFFSRNALELVRGYCRSNTGIKTILEMVDALKLGSRHQVYQSIQSGSIFPKTFKKNIEVIFSGDKRAFDEFYAALIVKEIPDILESIATEMSMFSRGVRYLRPLRAHAERFYRRQELAVDEVDASGDNVHMFLDSLSRGDSDKLKKWMNDNFGFSVYSKSKDGHVEILIEDKASGRSRNIADMGFGYSQFIPIAIQAWESSRKSQFNQMSNRNPDSIVIEQPELHLHPHYQMMFADLMASMAEEGGGRFIVETHSQHIVNRLGELVSRGKVKESDISILLFETNDDGAVDIIRSYFNADGVLMNWPFGFFEG